MNKYIYFFFWWFAACLDSALIILLLLMRFEIFLIFSFAEVNGAGENSPGFAWQDSGGGWHRAEITELWNH